MKRFLELISRGVSIIVRRIQGQGLRTTLLWAYARGIPKLTGVPILRYSRVTPNLYVGPQYKPRGKAHLEKNGFTADVNMRIEFDDAEHGLALEQYCYLPTVDDTAPSMEHLEQGAAFIQRVLAEGGKVYIHCAGGIGRAPTMAAAYLITTGMSLDEAVAAIRANRPFMYIMPPQMDQLRVFEKKHGKQAAEKS